MLIWEKKTRLKCSVRFHALHISHQQLLKATTGLTSLLSLLSANSHIQELVVLRVTTIMKLLIMILMKHIPLLISTTGLSS